jgi:2-polyprenyl-6-methoxyphenol hydroxylase-like FAD-dependent oxidoreductase
LKIVMAGGGAAGLFASLLLARAGHEVTVLERDRLEPAPDVESAAASAFRPAAPQIVQPHVVLARCRELLRQRLPDVYDGLLAAGAVEAPLRTQMPGPLPDTAAWPGDERLTMLMTRRSTVDWVLQRTVLAEPRVVLQCGARATGLVAVPGRPPRVTGVRTGDGMVPADLVIDATGRRSPVDGWLDQIGARPASRWRADCGVAYFSRHYRLRRGAALPGPPTTRIVAGLDEFTVGIWPADNQAMLLAVAPLAADRRFRAVKDPQVFTAVLRTVPVYAAWLDVLDPVSDVFPMAGLHNTLRRLVAGGAPVVTGLHAVGDSVCTTNPTLGRGLSLALSGAVDLLEVIGQHGHDLSGQALALDRLVASHVAPFYEDQAVIDRARLMMLRHTIFGSPAPDPQPAICGRVSYEQLRAAAPFDPAVFRAFWKIMGMICPPAQVYTDPHVVARTRQVLSRRGAGPPVAQPTREQLLAALAGSTRVTSRSH